MKQYQEKQTKLMTVKAVRSRIQELNASTQTNLIGQLRIDDDEMTCSVVTIVGVTCAVGALVV